jgi:hypothetical protein
MINESAKQLGQFFKSSVDLMKLLARATGHSHLRELNVDDLATWKRDMAYLSGVAYEGVTPVA